MNGAVPPDLPVSVTLSLASINRILTILSEQPYKQVVGEIESITGQAQLAVAQFQTLTAKKEPEKGDPAAP